MILFDPKEVYIEESALEHYLGKKLHNKYSLLNKPIHIIKAHHKIPELRGLPDEEYNEMKKLLVIGTRKSLKLTPNERSADYIVPFTSSGCSAKCLYCYLMCTFFTNSYLRVFVNRDEIWKAIVRKAEALTKPAIFEIGSNSDMVLEDSITGNLQWAIEKFAYLNNATATFATKFAEVEPLLNLDHKGKTQIRISVNPKKYIGKIEIGTASLASRISAANKLCSAGYRVGINIAPVMLLEDWQEQYEKLFIELSEGLELHTKNQLFIEVIFMTCGLANEKINNTALPNTTKLLDRAIMKPKGRGKYQYKNEHREVVTDFLKEKIEYFFPKATISYIC